MTKPKLGLTLTKQYGVYVDSTIDGKPYYVGKGNLKRVNQRHRNSLHRYFSEEHGFTRRIAFETDDEKEALLTEEKLVAELKTYAHGGEGWWGANLTRGGETSPAKDPVVAAKISRSKMGHSVSAECRAKFGATIKQLYIDDPSLRWRVGSSMRGKHHTPETRERMKLSHKRRAPISDETRQRLREASRRNADARRAAGYVHPKHTEASKRLIAEKALRWRALERFHRRAHRWFTRSSDR
jgi:hypothetical protein